MSHRRILVLEPFGGGSHRAFYEQWQAESQHAFTIESLPPVHWKWRSRHAAVTFAERTAARVERGETFDLVFCSDMLNVAEWRGLACNALQNLPVVVYFHENQFSYPLSPGESRDYHLAYNNILSLLSADATWFNSHYHRDEFQRELLSWLARMPDFRHTERLQQKISNSRVCPPGTAFARYLKATPIAAGEDRTPDCARPVVGWVARWEHDKAPQQFVEAMRATRAAGHQFSLCLLGQQFDQVPDGLSELLEEFGTDVLHCGFAKSLEDYWRWLQTLDIVVSTAQHEFFGMAIVEAIQAGAWPLLPDRLAYPEVLELASGRTSRTAFLNAAPELSGTSGRKKYFYGQDSADLKSALERLLLSGHWIRGDEHLKDQLRQRYDWRTLAQHYDALLEQIIAG